MMYPAIDHDYWGGANDLSVNDFRTEYVSYSQRKIPYPD